MQTPNCEAERRIQRLTLHLNPTALVAAKQLEMATCARGKLSVDTPSLSSYMRGKHVDIQEKVFDYFNAPNGFQNGEVLSGIVDYVTEGSNPGFSDESR